MMKVLQFFLPQAVTALALLLFKILEIFGQIPPVASLGQELERLFGVHGLWLVAALSFIENLPGVNAYFPGSIVLLTAMTATAGRPEAALSVYLTIFLPATLANSLAYISGRWLRSRASKAPESAEEWSTTDNPRNRGRMWVWYFSTYWHPHLASLTALAAGSRGILPVRHFRVFLPVAFSWSLFWGILLYSLGGVVNVKGHLSQLIYLYLALWFLWDLRRFWRQKIYASETGSLGT